MRYTRKRDARTELMHERWVGMVVSGDRIIIVDAEVPDTGQLVVQNDATWAQ